MIAATQAAAKLGIDVDTLLHWHSRGRGPAAAEGEGAELRYRKSDIEAWQDRLGQTHDDVLVLRRLPNHVTLCSTLRAIDEYLQRFEVRRGDAVLARFVSLTEAHEYLRTVDR